jgi:sterol 3beta-glucosyltransferase
MKALLLTAGTRGDVNPFAHLARQLLRDGHEVVLAAPDRSGVDLADLAVESLAIDYNAVVKAQGVSPWRAARTMRTTVRPMMRRLFTAAARAVRAHHPDVVVYHPKVLSAPFASEAFRIPHLVAEIVPSVSPTRDFPAPGVIDRDVGRFNRYTYFAQGASLRMFAKELSAAALEAGQTWSTHQTMARGSLVAVSPSLLPRPVDWPKSTRMTGPWVGPRDDVLDDETTAFLARGPYVYIGLGSMSRGDREARTRALVAGARHASLNVVCATGWGGLSVPVDLRGPDLLVVDEVPHTLVFPQAQAVVHHGGAGTVHAAARAGVPQIVMPFMGDQTFWAKTVTAAGLGPQPLDRRRLRAAQVAAAFEWLDRFAPATREMADRMGAEHGAQEAVRLLEAAAEPAQTRHGNG